MENKEYQYTVRIIKNSFRYFKSNLHALENLIDELHTQLGVFNVLIHRDNEDYLLVLTGKHTTEEFYKLLETMEIMDEYGRKYKFW